MALILALESSCDETAVAIVRDGRDVLAELVASQADDFAQWGGVVPELAARGHVAWLPTLIEETLREAAVSRDDLDCIAVGAWPGLIGSLLTSVTAAKMLAARWQIPLVAVDHVQAHLAAVHLSTDEVVYPFVGLVASGGHSHIYHCHAPGELELLGGTIDDAAGEAFDKAAVTLELGYPGGPIIDRLAQHGSATAYRFPRSLLREQRIAFSFAGLKTALLYAVRGRQGRDPLTLDDQGIADACASFQAAVVDCLAGKLLQAADQVGAQTIAVGGGVAGNSLLRARLTEEGRSRQWQVLLPHIRHCVDNAAMIGALAEHRFRHGQHASLDLVPLPSGRAGPRA